MCVCPILFYHRRHRHHFITSVRSGVTKVGVTRCVTDNVTFFTSKVIDENNTMNSIYSKQQTAEQI